VPVARLAFEGLSRRFDRLVVLDRVSGEVESGGLFAVRGPNGSGKSTLLRCLAGLLAPDRGRVVAEEDGRALANDERRRRVGLLAPDLALYDELSVTENLELVARLRGLPPTSGRSVAERFRLPPERPWRALSSGMRQRLRWAFALLHRPRLLLLDEPFQNLDDAGERIARDLLDEHLEAGGLAVAASPVSIPLPRITGELRLGL
jgi:ABC-type multidrug transport system ATPase subunit